MNRLTQMFQIVCLAAAVAAVTAAVQAQTTETPAKEASWQPPTLQDVKTQVFAALDAKKIDKAMRAKAEAIWADAPADASEDELLSRLSASFALVNPNAAKLASLCAQPRTRDQLQVPAQAWLSEAGEPPLLLNNMRLLFGRWLVQGSMYDEAQEQLTGIKATEVVAPASLLFYQSIVSHALLNKEGGLKSLDELLQAEKTSPRRYIALAKLMQEDLKGLKDDTLDHIARRMADIGRRLELAHAGPKVRKVEDGVIASLDKIIKDLEDKQNKGGGGGGGGSGSQATNRPNAPAADSTVRLGQKAAGDAEKKNVGAGADWGNLNPKDREDIMDSIARELPSHYRDAIEAYFKRLAAEGVK